MKKLLYIGFIFILPLTVSANEWPGVIDDVVSAIKKGDASAVAKFLDSTVEITILDKESNYSKSQAEQVLKDFFSKNKPSSFTIKHDGGGKSTGEFVIGEYKSGFQTFRITIYLKQSGTSHVVRSLRIEKE